MRRFVTSDCHGAYHALFQCLDRCGFDMEKDQLIFVGDVVDGWSETKECIDLLLCIKNLVHLMGNHDQWALDFYTGRMLLRNSGRNQELDLWLSQGGAATVKSYGTGKPMLQEHLNFLQQAKPYHVSEDNILFVHAGFDTSKPIEKNSTHELIWDREFIYHHYKLHAQKKPVAVATYKEVYIGHTPTIGFNPLLTQPLHMGNILLMDTGAAFTGYLSIVDIDSKEVWQSDRVMALYPDEEGRNRLSWNEMMRNGVTF